MITTPKTVTDAPAATAQHLTQDEFTRWIEDALTLPKFRAWLETRARLFPDGAGLVGVCSIPALCPIATYLHELNPRGRAEVFSLSATAWPEVGRPVDVPLPSWAIRFVRAVDRLLDIDYNVTAAQALAIVARIEADDAAFGAAREDHHA